MKETSCRDRRRLLKSAGAGFLAAIGTQRAEGAEAGKAKFKALNEGDRIDIGDRAEQILDTAYTLGYDLQKKHGGCARCAVAALQKAIEFIPEDKGLFRAASCLDGGATPHGLQSCGAFTGCGMVIGWTCGKDTFGDTELSHKLIRKVYEKFAAEYGSVLCKDTRQKAGADCAKVVALTVRWTGEALLLQFTNYQPRPKPG